MPAHIKAFQFHYGTIKSVVPKESEVETTHFNSTMVRLKDLDGGNQQDDMEEFQFHYGTIKRQVRVVYHCVPHIFQFHYGTIKS